MIVKTSDGVELHITKSGEGKPCLFLHGGPGYWSYSFEKIAGEQLESKLTMYYLDQRGSGRSTDSTSEDYSLHRMIKDIEEVRKELGIDKWIIMGHSFGGLLAINYAYYFPNNIEAIILINANLYMIESFNHQIEKAIQILELEEYNDLLDENVTIIDRFWKSVLPLIEKGLYYQFQFENIENMFKLQEIDTEFKGNQEVQNYIFRTKEYYQDFREITQEIDIPILVITGSRDDAIGPNHHKKFKFPNSYQVLIEGKHHPYMENPKEFYDGIKKFLNNI